MLKIKGHREEAMMAPVLKERERMLFTFFGQTKEYFTEYDLVLEKFFFYFEPEVFLPAFHLKQAKD